MLSRTKYDKCAVNEWAVENQGISTYLMDPAKYFHPDPRFFPFGLLGGNTVSKVSTDMVGLESELTGRSYYASKCPAMKYRGSESSVCPSNDPNSFPIGIDATSGMGCAIDYNLVNQPEKTFINQQRYTDVYIPSYDMPDSDFDPQPNLPDDVSKLDGSYN